MPSVWKIDWSTWKVLDPKKDWSRKQNFSYNSSSRPTVHGSIVFLYLCPFYLLQFIFDITSIPHQIIYNFFLFPWLISRVHRAGPRERIYFKPEEVKAAIVTCGGLCPGLNDVIRQVNYTWELMSSLHLDICISQYC